MSPGKQAAARAGKPVSEALARLRRHEISLDEYVDFRAARAVEHLKGQVSPEQLAIVQETIKESLTNDPVFSEQVRRVTESESLPGVDR
jgi:hypothetical protein